MNPFLVVSYDLDQEMVAYDSVRAESEEAARLVVEAKREDSLIICVLEPKELRSMADTLETRTKQYESSEIGTGKNGE